MLIGKNTNSLDPKGRVIIPAAFRDDLKERFVLTRGLDPCLYIFPLTEWVSFVERLRASLPTSKKEYRDTINFFTHNAVECEADKQGRILIPQDLREYASLDKDILFVGDYSKVQVWSPALYKEADAETVRNTLEEMNIIL